MSPSVAFVRHTIADGCLVEFSDRITKEVEQVIIRNGFVLDPEWGEYRIKGSEDSAPTIEHWRKMQSVTAALRQSGFEVAEPAFEDGPQRPFAAVWDAEIRKLAGRVARREELASRQDEQANARYTRESGRWEWASATQPARHGSPLGRQRGRSAAYLEGADDLLKKSAHHTSKGKALRAKLENLLAPETSAKRLDAIALQIKQLEKLSYAGVEAQLHQLHIDRLREERTFHADRVKELVGRTWNSEDFEAGDIIEAKSYGPMKVRKVNPTTLVIESAQDIRIKYTEVSRKFDRASRTWVTSPDAVRPAIWADVVPAGSRTDAAPSVDTQKTALQAAAKELGFVAGKPIEVGHVVWHRRSDWPEFDEPLQPGIVIALQANDGAIVATVEHLDGTLLLEVCTDGASPRLHVVDEGNAVRMLHAGPQYYTSLADAYRHLQTLHPELPQFPFIPVTPRRSPPVQQGEVAYGRTIHGMELVFVAAVQPDLDSWRMTCLDAAGHEMTFNSRDNYLHPWEPSARNTARNNPAFDESHLDRQRDAADRLKAQYAAPAASEPAIQDDFSNGRLFTL